MFISCIEHLPGFSSLTSCGSPFLGGPPAFTESSSHPANLPAVSPCLGRLHSLQRLVSNKALPKGLNCKLNLPLPRAVHPGSRARALAVHTELLFVIGRNINASGKVIPVCWCISQRMNGYLCLSVEEMEA